MLLVLACTGSGDTLSAEEVRSARRYAEALAALPHSPALAADHCRAVAMPELAADCRWAVVEVVGATDPEAGARLCRELPKKRGDECFFLLAEASRVPRWCEEAGYYEYQCRMHAFRDGLEDWVPDDAAPGQIEAEAQAQMQGLGLSTQDPGPWNFLYMRVLGGQPRVAPEVCTPVTSELARSRCEAVVLGRSER